MTALLGGLRPSELTVRGWQALALCVMGVMVLAGAVIGAVLIRHTDETTRELTDGIEPARVAAGQLQASLRDQETGIRGYLIAADRQFLTPYYDGLHTERAAADEIRRRLGQRDDLIDDLDALEQAAADWRSNYAEPAIVSVAPNGRNVTNRPAAERRKAEFDHLRVLFDQQNADLSAARSRAADELRRTDAWRNGVLIAMVLVFFGTAALLGLLVRDMVARPLAALAAACRRVTEGNFADEISSPKRPKDVRDMAIDVENMRKRIVEELEVSRSARELLNEQTIELRRSNTELEQIRLRRVTRSAGTAAQDRLVLPVAGEALRRQARRARGRVHRLRRRRGQAHAGADQRPAHVLARGPAQHHANRRATRHGARRRPGQPGRRDRGIRRRDRASGTAPAAHHRRPGAVDDAVWQNLIGNAVKFRHKDRRPRVVVDCERGSGDRDGEWLFTVSDNGIGIPQEFADKVFVIFQRLHGRDVYAGTGVGLALVKKIVEYHGGTVWIDPSYTGGTRIGFTIPIPAPVNESPAALEGAHR